jgi:hypothetical protein
MKTLKTKYKYTEPKTKKELEEIKKIIEEVKKEEQLPFDPSKYKKIKKI